MRTSLDHLSEKERKEAMKHFIIDTIVNNSDKIRVTIEYSNYVEEKLEVFKLAGADFKDFCKQPKNDI